MGKIEFNHRQISVNGISTHVVEIGDRTRQPLLFLHGYPQNWKTFESVMKLLKDKYYLLAIDLPGIGRSQPIVGNEKLTIAKFLKSLLIELELNDIIIVGHDVGGMVVYPFIKHYPEFVRKAVIICTAIPGIDPWEEVKRNPYIWHFAFYAVLNLPEQLISDKQGLLFDYFFNTITFNKKAINQKKRENYVEAYNSLSGLETGLGWYRAFPQDEKENNRQLSSEIPVLYLKGDKDFGEIDTYIKGFEKSGLSNITGESVPNSAHFAPEENPEFVARTIDNFITRLKE